MNSWHSFSPNGRWLVFSSKPPSLYTRLYLTHIDENIAVARTPEGHMLVAGGWGWILATRAARPPWCAMQPRRYRGAIDAGDGAVALDEGLMAELGTDDPTMLGRLLNDTRSAVIWGRYANAVFAAADAGSRLAQGVIMEGGAALAALVGVLIKRGADAASVVAGGGVIVEQPRLMAAFAAAMKKVSPDSAVVLLREPPVMGALALAERALPTERLSKQGSVDEHEHPYAADRLPRRGRPAAGEPRRGPAVGDQGAGRDRPRRLSGQGDRLRRHRRQLPGGHRRRCLSCGPGGLGPSAYCSTDLYDALDSAAEAFVALSASGQSREIAEVMQLRPKLPRIAICRGTDNPLAKVTDAVIGMNSGADNGASSTGYTGMLLAIGLLADRILGGGPSADWARLPGAVAEILNATADLARQAAGRSRGAHRSISWGPGAGFATAGEAAMLIREAVRVPAAGWDTLNYLHGPMESQDARTGLMAFGTGREVQIARDVAAFGCPSVLITSRTDVAARRQADGDRGADLRQCDRRCHSRDRRRAAHRRRDAGCGGADEHHLPLPPDGYEAEALVADRSLAS